MRYLLMMLVPLHVHADAGIFERVRGTHKRYGIYLQGEPKCFIDDRAECTTAWFNWGDVTGDYGPLDAAD